MKLGETEIKGLLADFGENIHLAKVNGRYVSLIETESILLEKGHLEFSFINRMICTELLRKLAVKMGRMNKSQVLKY